MAAKALRGQTRDPDSVEREDRELVRRVAAGDRQAFEEVYRRFARRLGGYLFKLLRQPDLVEEAVDDVMLVVWQKAGTLDPDARVSSWLFGIAHRKALKAMERSRRHLRAVHPSPDSGALTAPLGGVNPEELAVDRDALRKVALGIEALPPDQRAVVELTFFEGRSYTEIAGLMGCPVNTVKTRMFHARRQLGRCVGRGDVETTGGSHART